MHTYKKEKDGTYAVGQWLTTALEYKFMTLFYVADRVNAIASINALNGADLTQAPIYPEFKVIAEYEPPTHRFWKAVGSILVGFLFALAATIAYRALI